jgi:uncharacterized membrane protein YjgN (DUF898 family)
LIESLRGNVVHTIDTAAPATGRLPLNDDTGAPRAAQILSIRFVGSGSEFFRIWIVNLLLTLVTLGLYYPFAKVRRLRYFHGATEVGEHPLAFHADPWKMLRGYVLVALMLAAYSGAGHFSPTAGLIAFLIVGALWPALWHSSMRFRLANTSWRGLHMRYSGTRGQAYAVMAVPLAMAGALVLLALFAGPEAPPPAERPGRPPELSAVQWALALLPSVLALVLGPLFLWLLKRQQHNHYGWGGEGTRFTVGLGSFYLLMLKVLGVSILVAFVFGIGAAIVAAAGVGSGAQGSMGGLAVMFILAMLAYLVLLSVLGGYFTARLQNTVWNGTTSQHLRFESTLKARALAGLWLKNAVLVVGTLGLYFPFAQIASARLRLQAVTVHASVDPALMVSAGRSIDESAAGDAAGDLFGIDIGL